MLTDSPYTLGGAPRSDSSTSNCSTSSSSDVAELIRHTTEDDSYQHLRVFVDMVGNPIVMFARHPADYPVPTRPGDAPPRTCPVICIVVVTPGDPIKCVGNNGGLVEVGSISDADGAVEQVSFSICPMCDQPLGPREASWFEDLPVTKDSHLPSMYTMLWPHTISSPRNTNSNGRVLNTLMSQNEPESVRENLAALQKRICYQHRYELMMLPLSIQYLWPRRINFGRLVERMRAPEIAEALLNIYNEPWTSINVRKWRDKKGKYKVRSMSLLADRLIRPSSGLMSAGYFGQLGWAIMKKMIWKMLPAAEAKSWVYLVQFDSLDSFVEDFAIPHLCSYLISVDYQCDPMNGYHLFWLSEPFGAKEFPLSMHCPALDDLTDQDVDVVIPDCCNPVGTRLRPRSKKRVISPGLKGTTYTPQSTDQLVDRLPTLTV